MVIVAHTGIFDHFLWFWIPVSQSRAVACIMVSLLVIQPKSNSPMLCTSDLVIFIFFWHFFDTCKYFEHWQFVFEL